MERSAKNTDIKEIKYFIFFRIFEGSFYATIALCLYWAFTLNFQAIGIVIFLVVLQSRVKVTDRYQPYVDMFAKKLEISRYFKIRRFY